MEKAFLNKLIAFRKDLHKHPEVSEMEVETQKRILSFLEGIGVEGRAIGKTGVLVVLDSGKAGKTIMLRSDHDALPIQEINDFDHRSVNEGISHKCGHDGHTAIMCGVAKTLSDNLPEKGKVALLFQPAEENGAGAIGVLQDPTFDIQPDEVYALHNLPGYAMHKVVYREGSFTAAAKSIIIKLDGRTSHAAEPELGINPASAISALVQMFALVSQPDLDRNDFALTTPVYIHMGEKSYGVSAGHGEVHYTLRTWNNETMKKLTDKVKMEAGKIAQKHLLKCNITWTEEFDSNQNDPKAIEQIKAAISNLGLDSEERRTPFKWGEDFGLFTERFKGAMFGVGSGLDCPALHNPDYDFPDEIIPTCVDMFTEITRRSLNE